MAQVDNGAAGGHHGSNGLFQTGFGVDGAKKPGTSSTALTASSIVRRRLFIPHIPDVGGLYFQELFLQLPEPGLQLLYLALLLRNHLIQLLNGVFMVHQLDLYIGYPFVHRHSLQG
jgi:hypothetical protein